MNMGIQSKIIHWIPVPDQVEDRLAGMTIKSMKHQQSTIYHLPAIPALRRWQAGLRPKILWSALVVLALALPIVYIMFHRPEGIIV